MPQSSINFKPVKPTSESHNTRRHMPDYALPELSPNNTSWSNCSIKEKRKEQDEVAAATPGRYKKLRSNAQPIKEAVVNLAAHHTMNDIDRLAKILFNRFGILAFQAHIHRDEGKAIDDLNYHAHLLFDWQDKTTGKMIKLGKKDMSEIQTITAETLGLERGVEGSKAKRLEAQAFKASKDLEHIENEKKKSSNELKDLRALEKKLMEQKKPTAPSQLPTPGVDLFNPLNPHPTPH